MSHPSLRVKLITNQSEFEKLSADWNELADKTMAHSLFLRHEWFYAAWQWRKNDCSLNILCTYNDNNELIGICPFILETQKNHLFTFQVLKFLTVPDTQFCDIIADPQYIDSFIYAVMEWLVNKKMSWSFMDLTHIPETLSNCSSFYHKVMQSFSSRLQSFDVNLYINMAGTWAEFYAGKSRRLKKGNNLVANKIKKDGSYEIKWYGQNNESFDIENLIQTIVHISSKCWKAETGLSLDNFAPNQFISNLTKMAAENGWLSVWILFLDSKPVAMEYQLIYKTNAYALRSDFSEDYSHLSPGTFLNWKLLETMFDTDLQAYYMGPGKNEYKKRWNNNEERLSRLKIYNNNFAGKIQFFIEYRLKPAIKTLHSALIKSNEKAKP
jgi:CelD/BcsL family acetyltransferase involved in cellulose biosynthesis